MSPFPNSYPSAVDLPFNRACLNNTFTLEPPDGPDEGAGFWLPIMGGELLLPEGEGLQPWFGEALPAGMEIASPPLHFGSWQGHPCRAVATSRQSSTPAGWRAVSFSSADPLLDIDLASLAALAQQILHWERRSRCCSTCGSETIHIAGSWGKECSSCRSQAFPHLHPCVIVLIHRPGELLLARKAEWPEGRYGLVAGFLDFGEALEEAVHREVQEETGVKVRNLQYIGSQSWPFPSQIMAGFTAEYAGGEISVDRNELEDARWFSLDELPQLPPRRSIARFLIDQHLRSHD